MLEDSTGVVRDLRTIPGFDAEGTIVIRRGVGLALGVGLGIAIDRIGLGMGIGMVLGAALGRGWDQQKS